MTEETETKINDYRIATEALILVHENEHNNKKTMSEAAEDKQVATKSTKAAPTTEALILVHEKSMSEAAKDTDDTDANDTKDTKDTDAEDKQVW